MKIIGPLLVIHFLLFSCGKERTSPSSDNLIINQASSRAGFSDTLDQTEPYLSEVLVDQIPISNEQLKVWIPEKIGDMAQHKLVVGHKLAMGMSGAISTYAKENDKERQISMEVLDGAGTTGAVMIQSIIQKLEPDYEERFTNGFSKIYMRAGVRVWEKQNIDEEFTEIQFVWKNRFHFTFKGHQIELDELWIFVSEVMKEMD